MLQNLLNQYKEKIGGEPVAPIDESEFNIPAEPAVIQQESQNDNQASALPAAETKPAENKWGYDSSEMEYLSKNGYTPDKLEMYNSPYDPSKHGGYLQRMYETSITKPVPVDEKKVRNARIVSGVGDALGLLSMMISSGKGAYVKERDYERSALGRTEGKERDLRNRYLHEQSRYEDGLYNSKLKDFLQGLDDYNRGRAGIQTVISTKKKLDQFKAKLDADKAKAEEAAALGRGRLEETKRANKVREGQGAARVAQGWTRVNKSGGGKNDNYQIIIEANPNDTQAQSDRQLGADVRVFEMTPGEVDRYSREALANPDFMKRHPELLLQEPDEFGKGQFKYVPNKDVAAAYLRELYDAQWADPDEIRMPWLKDIVDRQEDWGFWED